MLVISTLTEIFTKNIYVVDSGLCTITTLFYLYYSMRTYKRDNLTGLLLRHNLNFDLHDLYHTAYELVLIDVDNFKLINDKYGHDMGDVALITVVDVMRQSLPKGCRLYRYGGDEFVIISRKVSAEALTAYLEECNNRLSLEDYRISFGIVHHAPGVPGKESLTEADKRMYENKRQLKSEDIWDDMTGLYNYRGFLDEMDAFRKNAFRKNHTICLIAIDVEHLSNINMAYGYTEGNRIIALVAKLLSNNLRGRDFIGHLGSDEFVVALECSGADDPYITEFINTFLEFIDSSVELSSKDYSVKLNVCKYYLEEDTTSEEAVNNVLYLKQEEKENRRKNSNVDQDQDYNDQEEKLVLDILNNNWLDYAMQPIVSAKDGSIVAYEALMRSTTETMVSPLKILKYAERNGRSYEIERYTFRNVLAKINEMLDTLPKDILIFINSLPGYDLSEMDYDFLLSKYSQLFPRVVVEITEQREMEEGALVALNSRRDRDGFQLAIDDYGSGYSNTNSLLRYMPRVVKLDRLLITGIDRNAKKQFFVNSIISFARDNDMLILAEGVETESELKTVVRLGVDLIQGYITARPSLELITEIPDKIRKIIVDQNLKLGSNQRMVYTASGSCELSVVQLAMEDYSKINISAEYVTLNGSTEYNADMLVRIKDGTNCCLTLHNVQLNSVDDEPCISLGEGCSVTLNIEGENSLNSKGIYVPESSTLTIIVSGTLKMFVKGHQCYAIGSDSESSFGRIIMNQSGELILNVDGEECTAIGGGITVDNSLIEIRSGKYTFNIAGVNAVAIGAFEGNVPIRIKDCYIDLNFRANTGVMIGSFHGKQDVDIRNFILNCDGSGSEIACIGSTGETSGSIHMLSGTFNTRFSGHIIFLTSCKAGDLEIDISHVNMKMIGEGDFVSGFGSRDEQATLSIRDASLDLTINAASPMGFGARICTIDILGPMKNVRINGNEVDIPTSNS